MRAARTPTLLLLLAVSVAPAAAETGPPDLDAVRSSVAQIFSLATLGTVTVRDEAVEVRRDGADYQVRLPLPGFSAPPDAAIAAVAHPVGHGMLDFTSMTLPTTGTIEPAQAGGVSSGLVTYSIGEQAITAKIDPALTMPSDYKATFGHVRMVTDSGERHGEQTFDRYAINGTIAADGEGRMTLTSQGSMTGLRFAARGPEAFTFESAIRAVAGHFSVEGLDRAQGARLQAAFRGATGLAQEPGAKEPGQTTEVKPQLREGLHAMVEAISGLMTRMEAEEVVEDLRLAIGAGPGANSGTIGRLRVSLSGDIRDERLNTQLGLTVDEMSSTAVPADTVALVPHHVDTKLVVSGVPNVALMTMLRGATDPDPDPMALMGQALALLADPKVRIAVETLTFDSGPLQVKASAKVVPRPSGQPGAEVHIVATGMDLLLAQAKTQPKLQSAMPMMLMAKGIGRPEGRSLVWDISLGDGPMTVNGLPMGQPGGSSR